MENEAPARWRKPPESALPSTLDKRATPRLYLGQSGRAPRDRALWNRDYGVGGPLSQEW